jgi:hypothetical protein
MSGHSKIQHLLLVPIPAYGEKSPELQPRKLMGIGRAHTTALCSSWQTRSEEQHRNHNPYAPKLVKVSAVRYRGAIPGGARGSGTYQVCPISSLEIHLGLNIGERVVSLFDAADLDTFALMPKAIEHYPAAYENLYRGGPIKCATTGTEFAAVPPPAALILDVFALPQLHATRAVSGNTVPIFMFIAGNASALIRMFGPESMGGQGDLWPKIDAEALRLGKTADEIGDQVRLFCFVRFHIC